MKPRNADHDVIIVGNGLAALTLALSLPESLRIALLCKYRLDDNASSRAQGGIAAVLDRLDRLDDHVADTLVAGAGLCDEAAVRAILSQGRAAIEWLIGTGVPFSRTDTGSLHLTREGGHGASRIAHVADHTGLSIMQALYRAVASRPNIRQLEQTMAVDLLQDDEDRCVGVRVLHQGQLQPMLATSVVLASGGCGQVYARTTTPTACTGDGIAMAFRAGCAAANMAFMQFHPTGFAGHAGPSRFLTDIGAGLSDTDRQEPIFLISEAVRGEGGLLRNEAGERFMPRYDERAELAPRDIVARAIAAEIGRQSLPHVWLDISHRPPSFILEHFPTIHAHCLAHGIDITRSPIPVGPVQHYTCGGIVCDTAGHTQVENLFCLGEAACTGLHGANRLASNSLLECVVMGLAPSDDPGHDDGLEARHGARHSLRAPRNDRDSSRQGGIRPLHAALARRQGCRRIRYRPAAFRPSQPSGAGEPAPGHPAQHAGPGPCPRRADRLAGTRSAPGQRVRA